MVPPKHMKNVEFPLNCQAVAPYNFVELPDKVVSAEELLPDHNVYHSDRHTGRLECTLTTSSPLYIRCGLTKSEFEKKEEQTKQNKEKIEDLPEFFYTSLENKKPVIPGSSLRGMLRTLLEIISFGKINYVSDHDRFFFRAVAADREDPLKAEYEKYIRPEKIKAGYLKKDTTGWTIDPAEVISDKPFAWVYKEIAASKFPHLLKFDQDSEYRPQHIQVSFENAEKNGNNRLVIKNIGSPDAYPQKGLLVTSGNMKQGDDPLTPSTRKYHCIIGVVSSGAPSRGARSNQPPLKIDEAAIDHYRIALTRFQKEPPFNKDMGILVEGYPIFYCQPNNGESVTLFGHSPNFRIPYSPKGNGQAASAVDFIPERLRDSNIVDFADAIFGYVRETQALAGRVSVTDATCISPEDPWLSKEATTPQILTNPKPTTFQHYLVQTDATKSKLKHYASEPNEDTVIRGHKLYWHKGKEPNLKHPNPEEVNETQLTKIRPIKPGIQFGFKIYFENLSDIELGALQWILDIAQNEKYRLSLGMGKPLGMGAIKIDYKLYLSGRPKRYATLFDEKSNWEMGNSIDDKPDYDNFFKNHMMIELRQTEKFEDIDRIQMLLAMLNWNTSPDTAKTRYMEIKRQEKPLDDNPNEYKTRRVLPTPLQVAGMQRNDAAQTVPQISTVLIPAPQPLQKKFVVDQEVQAKIIELRTDPIRISETKTVIKYEVKGKILPKKEEIYNMEKKGISLNVGDTVTLKITELNLDGNIKKYERLDSTESASTSSL